jgi:hypothetical protein
VNATRLDLDLIFRQTGREGLPIPALERVPEIFSLAIGSSAAPPVGVACAVAVFAFAALPAGLEVSAAGWDGRTFYDRAILMIDRQPFRAAFDPCGAGAQRAGRERLAAGRATRFNRIVTTTASASSTTVFQSERLTSVGAKFLTPVNRLVFAADHVA